MFWNFFFQARDNHDDDGTLLKKFICEKFSWKIMNPEGLLRDFFSQSKMTPSYIFLQDSTDFCEKIWRKISFLCYQLSKMK